MTSVSVNGASVFRSYAQTIRSAGPEMRVEFRKALNRATKPIKEDAKANALATLPKRNGLAKTVAGSTYSTRYSQGANAGVRIEVKGKGRKGKPVNVYALDNGTVTHPTYGHRPEVVQRVRPQWFTGEPVRKGVEHCARELLVALDTIVESLS